MIVHMISHSSFGEKMRRTFFLFPVVLLLIANAAVQPVAAVASAQIQNDSSFVDSLGYFHVVGEVLNSGDVWLRFVKITGTLRNASGQIVDVTFTYAVVQYLPPNQRAPFDLFEVEKAKSAKVSSYSLALEFQQTSTIPQNTLTVQDATSSTDSLGYLNIVGQVKNSGAQTSNFTKVIASYYDATGKVIYVDFTFTSPDAIPPGQSYGFKLIGPNAPISSRVKTYAIIAESSQYTSVPEFPWQFPLITIIVLSLGAIMLHKKRRFLRDDFSSIFFVFFLFTLYHGLSQSLYCSVSPQTQLFLKLHSLFRRLDACQLED
jgi:hypothetical protein